MVEYIDWAGCYKRSWGKELVPEAYRHPAKVSFSLTKRIYDFLFEHDLLHAGDSVIDPFAGIGGCAYQALLHGCHFTGVELEEKFVALANANIKMWNERYTGKLARFGTARVLQGDSRNLAAIVGPANCAVSSPPYASDTTNTFSQKSGRDTGTGRIGRGEFKVGASLVAMNKHGYSLNRDNLANLPEGEFRAAISSPPYEEARIGESSGAANVGRNENYGNGDGQLGNMQGGDYKAAISSPPYADGFGHGGQTEIDNDKKLFTRREFYGDAQGQLGAMSAGDYAAAVSSPPYETTPISAYDGSMGKKFRETGMTPRQRQNGKGLVNEHDVRGTEETFWTASRTIIEQVHAVLAPRGVAVWVVKDFVRNKERVPFCDQWRELCEHVGFETMYVARAWLVENHGTQFATDGNHKHLKTERKSFFRRLSEKRGAPRIDFEVVLFMQKTCE